MCKIGKQLLANWNGFIINPVTISYCYFVAFWSPHSNETEWNSINLVQRELIDSTVCQVRQNTCGLLYTRLIQQQESRQSSHTSFRKMKENIYISSGAVGISKWNKISLKLHLFSNSKWNQSTTFEAAPIVNGFIH